MKRVKLESRIIIGALFALTIISIVLTSYYSYQVYDSFKNVKKLQEKRIRSITLADELRQSSDDLTNFARMYAITGNKQYKFIYNRIIDIRNGTETRPPGYENIYWDLNVLNLDGLNLFTVAVDENGNELGTKKSFEDLMREVGMDQDEWEHLNQSKQESDALAQLEMEVFRIIETGHDPQLNQVAVAKLFDANYLQLKATIMKPIREFYIHVDERTRDELNAETQTVNQYILAAIGLSVATLLLVSILRTAIYLGKRKNQTLLENLNRKNAYLEHAAKIIRHDMHSGINTYIPRGIKSLERKLQNLKELGPENLEKLTLSMRLLKEGIQHTQKVYVGVREFTDLVKKDAVLKRERLAIKPVIEEFLKSTSYRSQVKINELGTLEINESLFCTAVDNLVRNGLRYNDSKTRWVEISRHQDQIWIQDNGRGMTQQEFLEYSKPYTRKPGNPESGSGLGLNITVAIMREHGFELEAEKLDLGTLIKITIGTNQ